MSKRVSDGWPDPDDWIKRLHERLEAIGEDFDGTPWDVADDPDDFSGLNRKQSFAAEAVLVVCNALRELPAFEKSKGVATLHTLAGAMRDIVMGGEPRLLKSVRPGTSGGDGMDRIYLREQVVLAVRLLVQAHGLTNAKAHKVVSAIFANAGATGRQGGRLSATTVKDWCKRTADDSRNVEDYRMHNHVEAKLIAFRGDPRWPGSYEDALSYIERIANDPLVSLKYG